MADELRITERGAQKARDRLMAAGWIEQVPFRGQKKARYRITFPLPHCTDYEQAFVLNYEQAFVTPFFRYFR